MTVDFWILEIDTLIFAQYKNQIMGIVQNFAKEWNKGSDIALLLFRFIFACLLILEHGLPKLSKAFSGDEIQFLDPIGIGMHSSFYLALFAETVVALFLMLGLFTRFASFILIINFAVIVYLKMFVSQSPIGDIEHIIFYFVAFVALFFSGAGKFSLDYTLFSKKK